SKGSKEKRELLVGRGVELGGVDPEVVFGVELDVGEGLEFRFVEGWKLGYGGVESLEGIAGVGEAVVIGVAGFAIGGSGLAPGEGVSLRGGGDGGLVVACVALDLGEDVQGIGVKEWIRAALRSIPDLIEEIAGRGEVFFAPVEFGECGKCGEFVFKEADR